MGVEIPRRRWGRERALCLPIWFLKQGWGAMGDAGRGNGGWLRLLLLHRKWPLSSQLPRGGTAALGGWTAELMSVFLFLFLSLLLLLFPGTRKGRVEATGGG